LALCFVLAAVLKAFPNAKQKEISDAVAAWLRAAPFRKGGPGALHPRKRRRRAREEEAAEMTAYVEGL